MTAESQSTLERAFQIRLDDSPFRVLPGEQVRLCGRRDSCPSRPALVISRESNLRRVVSRRMICRCIGSLTLDALRTSALASRRASRR